MLINSDKRISHVEDFFIKYCKDKNLEGSDSTILLKYYVSENPPDVP